MATTFEDKQVFHILVLCTSLLRNIVKMTYFHFHILEDTKVEQRLQVSKWKNVQRSWQGKSKYTQLFGFDKKL